jgi:hypothetical protein
MSATDFGANSATYFGRKGATDFGANSATDFGAKGATFFDLLDERNLKFFTF